MDEAVASMRGQVIILQENIEKANLERESLMSANHNGDLAIKMHQEWLEGNKEEQPHTHGTNEEKPKKDIPFPTDPLKKKSGE